MKWLVFQFLEVVGDLLDRHVEPVGDLGGPGVVVDRVQYGPGGVGGEGVEHAVDVPVHADHLHLALLGRADVRTARRQQRHTAVEERPPLSISWRLSQDLTLHGWQVRSVEDGPEFVERLTVQRVLRRADRPGVDAALVGQRRLHRRREPVVAAELESRVDGLSLVTPGAFQVPPRPRRRPASRSASG